MLDLFIYLVCGTVNEPVFILVVRRIFIFPNRFAVCARGMHPMSCHPLTAGVVFEVCGLCLWLFAVRFNQRDARKYKYYRAFV